MGSAGGAAAKNLLVNAEERDMGSIPGFGRSSGVGNGNLPQYSCLENPMHRGAVWGHRIRLSDGARTLGVLWMIYHR